MRTFTGRCIGGPATGETHDSPQSVLFVRKTPLVKCMPFDPMAMPKSITISNYRYRHEFIRMVGDEVHHGFWYYEGKQR